MIWGPPPESIAQRQSSGLLIRWSQVRTLLDSLSAGSYLSTCRNMLGGEGPPQDALYAVCTVHSAYPHVVQRIERRSPKADVVGSSPAVGTMELHQWAPWGFCVLGLTHPWLLGNKLRIGWVVSGLSAFLGILYNLMTDQYGFVPSCTIAVLISVRNFNKWGKESAAAPAAEREVEKEADTCS